MLQNTPVALLAMVCRCRVREVLNLAQGIDSGQPRPKAHRCTGFI